MTFFMHKLNTRLYSFAFVSVLGLFSFLSPPEDPQKVLGHFGELYIAQDAVSIMKIMHPDVIEGKDIDQTDIESSMKAFRTGDLKVSEIQIENKMKGEDETQERIQTLIVFTGPNPGAQYVGPSKFFLRQLWVLEKGRWWLERTISAYYEVESQVHFPTPEQQENAQKFQAALAVWDKIKPQASSTEFNQKNSSAEDLIDLERRYRREKDKIGPDCEGVDLLLKIAGKPRIDFLSVYYGDFSKKPHESRKPVPWEVISAYVNAALSKGQLLEKNGKQAKAELIYRKLLNLGNSILAEPGGYQFLLWGSIIQKQAAEDLARVVLGSDKQKFTSIVAVAGRRIDVLQTILASLDDLTDYRSLRAAIASLERPDDDFFRAWGINTLAILSVKGAPADKAALENTGNVAIVKNTTMQKIAREALERLSQESAEPVQNFIKAQTQWVQNHNVYGRM
jgi:hypothetical protein